MDKIILKDLNSPIEYNVKSPFGNFLLRAEKKSDTEIGFKVVSQFFNKEVTVNRQEAIEALQLILKWLMASQTQV